MPNVFIGSSNEARGVALQLQLLLDDFLESAEVKCWEECFQPGYGFLETLVASTREFDFAVVLLTPDDVVESRSSSAAVPRDNLLFEAGLFVGALGRERTFLLVDDTESLRLPSDLGGIKHLLYSGSDRSKLRHALRKPASEIAQLIQQLGEITRRAPAPRPDPAPAGERIARTAEAHADVYGVGSREPDVAVWGENIRPQLHNAANYGSPTYFLDVDLHVVSWNVSFETLFRPILSQIYHKHVNHFIAALSNSEEVFQHARDFTRKVEETGELPLVDSEPLEYHSDRYGDVSFVKFACKLHDDEGEYRGWSVRLDVRDVNWVLYTRDITAALHQAALWNLYASAYDPILQGYPEYLKLLEAAADELGPASRTRRVVDLGAGSGNMSSLLARRGFTVTAVENSLGMFDRLCKREDADQLTILKGNADNLKTLTERYSGLASAVTMINVLYAVQDPLACLDSIFELLEPGGRLVITTTHRESNFDKLLDDVARSVREREDAEEVDLESELSLLLDANRDIERTIGRRHTREQYLDWIESVGFQIRRYEPSVYCDALMLVTAEKPL